MIFIFTYYLIGILITHESMKRLSGGIKNGTCVGTFSGYGDVVLGHCAFKNKIELGNSRDDLGRERFQFSSYKDHFVGYFPGKGYKKIIIFQ